MGVDNTINELTPIQPRVSENNSQITLKKFKLGGKFKKRKSIVKLDTTNFKTKFLYFRPFWQGKEYRLYPQHWVRSLILKKKVS